MGTTFFTSDLHFCHAKDMIFKPRGFECIEDMNEAIIERWNATIGYDDKVYILGDIMLLNNDEGIELFSALNGLKKIILGNHDSLYRAKLYSSVKDAEVLGYADMIKINDQLYYLSHYPSLIANFGETWGPYNLHGHTHSKDKFELIKNRCYNVGVDAHNCTPISIEEIEDDLHAI